MHIGMKFTVDEYNTADSEFTNKIYNIIECAKVTVHIKQQF